VRSGRPLQRDLGDASPAAVFAPDGEFLALYEPHGPVAKPVAVFAPA
jgi:tRNA pseudouridine55 synthase